MLITGVNFTPVVLLLGQARSAKQVDAWGSSLTEWIYIKCSVPTLGRRGLNTTVALLPRLFPLLQRRQEVVTTLPTSTLIDASALKIGGVPRLTDGRILDPSVKLALFL
jgi:hypothetical protein